MTELSRNAPDAAAFVGLAGEAARASRDMLAKGFGRAEIVSQQGRDIKLGEDRRSQDMIVARLAADSDFPVLAEESGWIGAPAAGDTPYWVVDPLDGSFNYRLGVPLCCTAVALCVGRDPVAGAIYDFNRDELFAGGSALGLSINGAPSEPTAWSKSVLATGFPVAADHSEAGMLEVVQRFDGWKKIRMIGSAALSLAWVAAGRFDGYVESGIRWWDVAAGLALVRGAGGAVTIEGEDVLGTLAVAAYGGPQEQDGQ